MGNSEQQQQQLLLPHGLLLTAYAGNGLMRLSTRMPSPLTLHSRPNDPLCSEKANIPCYLPRCATFVNCMQKSCQRSLCVCEFLGSGLFATTTFGWRVQLQPHRPIAPSPAALFPL